MKLIGNLKKQVEETTSKEEAKEVIEKAGMELTDEELDKVSGGCCGDDDCYNTKCSWNPNGKDHELELIDGKIVCKYCGVYMG